MAKDIMVNFRMHGFDERSASEIISEESLAEYGNVVIVLNSASLDTEVEHYNAVKRLCKEGKRVILIGVESENNCFEYLAALMISYDEYDIYQVKGKGNLTADYISKLIARHASYEEVQNFISDDITGFAELGTIFMGIESLTADGDIESLKGFLESHVNSVGGVSKSIDYLKKNVDIFRSEEMLNKLLALKEDIKALEAEKTKMSKQIDDKNEEISNRKKELLDTKSKMERMDEQISLLESQASSGGIIKEYNEVNTATLHCRVTNIMYFKEISYVEYTNSMVHSIAKYLEQAHSMRVKLVIYDNRNAISCVYNPLQIVGTREYNADRANLIKSTNPFVVIEPNPIIITDLVTSESGDYDLLIIYDRMKQANDVVIGNNVSKIYVAGSQKSLDEARGIMHIKDMEMNRVIVPVKSRLANAGCMYISEIEGYSGCTDTAKVSKYAKLPVTAGGKQTTLVGNLLSLANVTPGK